jgi:lipoyl(octanoyl) transferase
LNHFINKNVIFQNLGLVDYQEAWDYQENLHKKIVDVKLSNRDFAGSEQVLTENYLLFCEHPHVFTLGKSGNISNLLLDEKGLDQKNARFYQINRGGDITYHGPGQIVGYPILDLENFYTDIHQYLRVLEETVIRTCNEYNLEAGRIDGLTGVWLDHIKQIRPRKICAIGVRSSHWVTMHGFAFNINTDLSYFKNINPCGITDKEVTSLSLETGRDVDISEVHEHLKKHFIELFEVDLIENNSEEGYPEAKS